MVKRLQVVIVALFALAACQPLALTSTSVNNPLNSGYPVSTSTAPVWIETVSSGISVGMWQHPGWEANTTNGIVLVETLNHASGGLVAYMFVPRLENSALEIAETEHGSYALDVLNAVVANSNQNIHASAPTHFMWDGFDCAYYLLSGSDGVHALVLALTEPQTHQLVVFNVSAASSAAALIRSRLPDLLDGMSINGHTFSAEALDVLPDPLPFPHYNIAATPTPHSD